MQPKRQRVRDNEDLFDTTESMNGNLGVRMASPIREFFAHGSEMEGNEIRGAVVNANAAL